MDRTVPPPWTAMRVDASTVRLWAREVALGANGLPARIQTLDVPVLAAPATITASTPAGALTLVGSGVTFTETADDRVAWRASLSGGGIRAELAARMEFDGLLYCAINLLPESGAAARIDGLHIDFPMNPHHAAQLIANGGGKSFRSSWVARR